MHSELDQPIWAVVSASQVICMSKMYQQCIEIVEFLGNKHTLAITTNEAAAQFKQNKINHAKIKINHAKI